MSLYCNNSIRSFTIFQFFLLFVESEVWQGRWFVEQFFDSLFSIIMLLDLVWMLWLYIFPHIKIGIRTVWYKILLRHRCSSDFLVTHRMSKSIGIRMSTIHHRVAVTWNPVNLRATTWLLLFIFWKKWRMEERLWNCWFCCEGRLIWTFGIVHWARAWISISIKLLFPCCFFPFFFISLLADISKYQGR